MIKRKKLSIIIPCHNEEKGIGKVIDSIPIAHLRKLGYHTTVIVIDNNSTDGTRQIVATKDAIVVHEHQKGKGNAIKAGLRAIPSDTDYVVMLDGDNTYKAKEIPRMIEPLASNFCQVVVGSRLGGKMKKHSLRFRNRVVNWGFTFLVRQFYRANITDVLSGYFAWKKKAVMELLPYIEASGFGLEMDMITKMTRLKHEMYSVPITYDKREGESKIEALKDGFGIFAVFFLNLSWRPHLAARQGRSKFSLEESL